MIASQTTPISKTQVITDYFDQHPHASATEVLAVLGKQGIEVSRSLVNQTRSRLYPEVREEGEGKTILRPPNWLEPLIVKEMYRRGGRVHVGTSRKPGQDRDLYRIVARQLGVTDQEQELTLIDICPGILTSGRQDAERDAKRNAWDYTMLVATQHLRDKTRGGAYLVTGAPIGVWELTLAGMEHGRALLSQDNG